MTSYSEVTKHEQRRVDNLVAFSGLDPGLIANIIQYSKCLRKPRTEIIDQTIFMAQMAKQFGITNGAVLPLMYSYFKDNDIYNGLTIEEFCKCICTFLTNDLEEKIDYVFHIYDRNMDGVISFAEMQDFLQSSVLGNKSIDAEKYEENSKELMDMAIQVFKLGPNLNLTLDQFRFRKKFTKKTAFQIKEEFQYERVKSLNSIPSRYAEERLYPIVLELP